MAQQQIRSFLGAALDLDQDGEVLAGAPKLTTYSARLASSSVPRTSIGVAPRARMAPSAGAEKPTFRLTESITKGMFHSVRFAMAGRLDCRRGFGEPQLILSELLQPSYRCRVFTVIRLLFGSLLWAVRSRATLAAEILALRHQLGVLQRSRPARLPLTCWDRALWAFVLRRWSGWKRSLRLVEPDTVVAWHRRTFRLFWRRKSLGGRPTKHAEIRQLIQQMAQDNALWGAPRIHGELRKLGYQIAERSVSRYLARIRPAPTERKSQTWATFLKNHTRDIVAADMFVVPTVQFQILYIFIVLGLERRRLIFSNVTTNPTAEWLAQQIVNAFPWNTAPKFLIRDRDGAYGSVFSRRVKSLGIREIRTAVQAPKMNAFAERIIGTLRRECFDHVIVLSEQHARRLLREFRDWYNQDRVHLSLDKDAPEHRPVESPEAGKVVALPRLGGLHHRYSRRAA